MNQKERLEMIRRKRLREQRRRKILIRRVFVFAVAIIIAALVIFAIKGCVSSVSQRAEQKRQEELAAMSTQTPTTAPAQKSNSSDIDQNYYQNSAFIGNSFVDGMMNYSLVEGVDYFARIGLNVNAAMTKSTSTGTVPVIEELNNGKQYNKIFMIFGENELGWANSDTFVEQYGALIDKAKSYQSTAKIYLLAITPVTKEVSDNNVDNTNNEQIVKYNELIKKLAESKGVVTEWRVTVFISEKIIIKSAWFIYKIIYNNQKRGYIEMKKLVFGLAAVMMCVSLAGCGGKAVDINELASALSSDGKFAEQLTEVSSDIAEKRYMISDGEVEECVSYTGTPAVVDEITIFKTSDTESVKEKAEQHIETQKTTYTSYAPNEVSKLDDCVVETVGDYVIVCVSEDSSSVQSIIDQYTK